MALFRTIVFAAALAGLVAGLAVTLLQAMGTTPLILAAEAVEQHGPAALAAHDHAAAGGFGRAVRTGLANVVIATGFALLLVAGYALTGRKTGWREGLLWGLGGFLAFMLAPSLGLPPELPGTAAAELGARQAWWITTALATAAALALLAFRRSPVPAALAVLLLAAPHLIGAPQPEAMASELPPELTYRFEAVATVTSLLFWALLGVSSAILFQRLSRAHHAPQPG